MSKWRGRSGTGLMREVERREVRGAEGVLRIYRRAVGSGGAFSLSFGAPVIAQFVIEDHALRHSWHHLGRIRKALEK